MFLESAPSSEECLDLKDTFSFSCHKDLACFNTCCRNKHLPLTPYDILRLKNALNLHSDEFLSRYTLYRLDKESGFPIISLRMGGGPRKACPFVGSEGCKVYKDRPMACRLFPLGRSSGMDRGSSAKVEFYYLLDIPGCLGFDEKKIWSVKEWIDNQGLSPYAGINDRMLEFVFHDKRDRRKPLDERQLQKVMVACYNLDLFREFVSKTDFFERYAIDEETMTKVREDETSLLELAFSYLGRTLFP